MRIIRLIIASYFHDRQRTLASVFLLVTFLLVCAGCTPPIETLHEENLFTDVAILSTTDMHGKCWKKIF